ncbi:lysosomal alpha-mannosidase-like isoform X2 [Lycorma delicatula]|uniref:lysosomal alpha-mannosidase-like isoform X2 n=1 Tax=Lycorma delicatula TaxID=130591 RepID=UPI003F510AE2
MHVNQGYYAYLPYKNSVSSSDEQFSGHYIFRPNYEYVEEVSTYEFDIKVFKGPIVHEVQVKINEWSSQIIRIYYNTDYIEFDWLIGDIPLSENGKEVISRFEIEDLKGNAAVFTDSNGREMISRKKAANSPVAATFYPVTSKITITDDENQYSVLTDRPQGGSWNEKMQSIELMIHRRITSSDEKGLLEALNENAFGKGLVVRGSHYLVIGKVGRQNSVERLLARQKYLQPCLFFSPLEDVSFLEWRDIFKMEYSGLKAALPNNVNLLTVEPLDKGTVLIRLEHVFEKNEDKKLSQPVTVNLNRIRYFFRDEVAIL